MYSLFLFTSALSLLLFLRALERSTRGRWAAWAAATLALLAAQPYGVLVLGTQVAYVAVLRLRRPLPLRAPLIALAAVVVLAGPLWRTYFVLASRLRGRPRVGQRFGARFAGRCRRLPLGRPGRLHRGLVLGRAPGRGRLHASASSSCARARPESAILTAAIAAVPVVALVAARSGAGASLETRHLIFVLPFTAMLFVLGLRWLAAGAGKAGPPLVAVVLVALVAFEIAWGLDRTRWLYTGEPEAARRHARTRPRGSRQTGRVDDVLLGFEPTYLDAWEKGAPFGDVFIPRADPKLALDALEEVDEPLGRGVWVLDASDELNQDRVRLDIPLRSPGAGVRGASLRAVPDRPHAGASRRRRVVPRGDATSPAAELRARDRRRRPQLRHGRGGAEAASRR